MQSPFITVTEIGTDAKMQVRKNVIDVFATWKGKGPNGSEMQGTAIWSRLNSIEKPFVICQELPSQLVELLSEDLTVN